jgi:hypothetical protein
MVPDALKQKTEGRCCEILPTISTGSQPMNRQQLISRISILQYRARDKIRRYRLAIAYARQRIDADQANDIIYDCQAAAGWYPLETFSADGCLQTALDCYWQPHPELESLVQSACDRVASKWSSNGHAADAAEDWALDLVADFAAARGIALLRHEDDPATLQMDNASQHASSSPSPDG